MEPTYPTNSLFQVRNCWYHIIVGKTPAFKFQLCRFYKTDDASTSPSRNEDKSDCDRIPKNTNRSFLSMAKSLPFSSTSTSILDLFFAALLLFHFSPTISAPSHPRNGPPSATPAAGRRPPCCGDKKWPCATRCMAGWPRGSCRRPHLLGSAPPQKHINQRSWLSLP